jgi:hypothetical protein
MFALEAIQNRNRDLARTINEEAKLIPIFVHRMMPDDPHLAGNPVFSVHQTDIIHYGFALADYPRK